MHQTLLHAYYEGQGALPQDKRRSMVSPTFCVILFVMIAAVLTLVGIDGGISG